MRARTLVLVSLAAVAAASCGSSEAASRSPDGTLRLELGGAQGSLREALSAAGVRVTPKRVRSTPPEPEQPAAEPTPSPLPRASPSASEPAPGPQAAPAPREDFKIVVLERNQTLIHLAKIHLGNGNRFREILAANGWTEADARRLREGTKVKVPIDGR
jgi:hypothetical protein